MKIYISGSIAYDRIMDFPGKFADYILPDKLHILNVCFNVNGLNEKFGGTAGNIAFSLSLLNESPCILATIGKDYQTYFDWLTANRISSDMIKIIQEEFTAGAYITTDMSDNQITGFNPGAMKYASGHDLNGAAAEQDIVMIAPGNLDDMTAYAMQAKKKGIRYICDPGQSLSKWDGESLREWIDGSTALISNDYELEMIVKITGLAKAELIELAGTVITTLGEKGSMISSSSGDISVPAAKAANVLDPTGAGDAYRAGLLKGFAQGKDMETSARLGSVAAVYAVEHHGTQEHRYTMEEFMERYKTNFGEI